MTSTESALPISASPLSANCENYDSANGGPIRLLSLRILTGRLIAEVAIEDDHFCYSNESLATMLSAVFPDLPNHTCVNPKGNTLQAVLSTTDTPHLLEHLTIAYQVRDADLGDGHFVGATDWIRGGENETLKKARVQVSFADDLVALRSFNKALMFLNNAVLTYLT